MFFRWNRNRSALVRELLSDNSLFVGQLYVDKSLALRRFIKGLLLKSKYTRDVRKKIAFFLSGNLKFQVTQKCSFNVIEELSVAGNEKLQPM